jgi:C4-type Zn-finger protein
MPLKPEHIAELAHKVTGRVNIEQAGTADAFWTYVKGLLQQVVEEERNQAVNLETPTQEELTEILNEAAILIAFARHSRQ